MFRWLYDVGIIAGVGEWQMPPGKGQEQNTGKFL